MKLGDIPYVANKSSRRARISLQEALTPDPSPNPSSWKARRPGATLPQTSPAALLIQLPEALLKHQRIGFGWFLFEWQDLLARFSRLLAE